MKQYLQVLERSFRHLNPFEILLLIVIIALALASFVIKGDFGWQNSVAAFSAILGVFCVVLGAKGSIANWIFGIIEGVLHIVICFFTHMYGDMLQRIFWNLPMQFVGWKSWKKREIHDNSERIRTRYMTWTQRAITLFVVCVLTSALAVFLLDFGPWLVGHILSVFPDAQFKTIKLDYDQPVQLWLDSFTTVMSIVALYISVKAYVEQWYMWLIINIAYISMWIMSDSEFSFMTVAKYSVYLINTFYGIYTWHRLSKI